MARSVDQIAVVTETKTPAYMVPGNPIGPTSDRQAVAESGAKVKSWG